jgi:hypothetical protein
MEKRMKFLYGLVSIILAGSLHASSAQDYLPADADLDPGVPTPESVLGWDIGDWHVSHDKLVHYMQVLADHSPRLTLKVIGNTYEERPLLQLTVTSPANHEQIESLRSRHLEGAGPLVVWLGYSVHGNEPSGSNASMLVAYYLAASRSAFVEGLLERSVILIDPSINPDGLNRFASWANANAGSNPVTDPATRQHVQTWPTGRTNHYWFDLNRDWLPLVHPSSRARIEEFHRWRPHVLTDHHEQTGYPGFFFQPGVPTRQNALTPARNLELTRMLAAYHSAAMDEAGQPYFTEDAFDDFYFGKGSTYPDINGSVGILFEQKAIRGQALQTDNGIETFRQAIVNQFRMSLSTLTGSSEIREDLIRYQRGFHEAMLERADKREFKAWLIGDDGDPARAAALLETLSLHRISYSEMDETVRASGHEYAPGHAWVIPARQEQFGLLESLMERRTSFTDNSFYDVSAWTLPLAYNLPFTTVNRVPATRDATAISSGRAPDPDARAWAIPWNQLGAPALLQELLSAEVRARVATMPFSASTDQGLQQFQRGTVILQSGIQDTQARDLALASLQKAALSGTLVYNLESTLTAFGPDLGADHFKILRPVKPLLVGGPGTSTYDVGEQWFVLDQRLRIATPITDAPFFDKVNLQDYTHLLLADGSYDRLKNGMADAIAQWVRDGGILVAVGGAASWAEELCLVAKPNVCKKDSEEKPATTPVVPRAYADFDDDKAKQIIGGAIVSSLLDLSHPIAYGYQRVELPLFRRGTTELKPSENAYSTPVRYGDSPLMAGYIGSDRLAAIEGRPAVIAERLGKGLVIRFANNPVFRGFWRGTERLFVNALFFGQVIKPTEMPESVPQPKPETPRH